MIPNHKRHIICQLFTENNIICSYIKNSKPESILIDKDLTNSILNNKNFISKESLRLLVGSPLGCLSTSTEGLELGLCDACDNAHGYFKGQEVNFTLSTGVQKIMYKCYSNLTKPHNMTFSSDKQSFVPCYESCYNCTKEGNESVHNCDICSPGLIKRPNSLLFFNNCVKECTFYYYYNEYDQYKCTEVNICDNKKNSVMTNDGKCVGNCKNETGLQFNGKCVEKCLNNDYKENLENFVCEIKNENECSILSDNITIHYSNLTKNILEVLAVNYAKENRNTMNNIRLYKNDNYSITLYRSLECLNKMLPNSTKIDFLSCYQKIHDLFGLPELIVLIFSLFRYKQFSQTSYSFYHPFEGTLIDASEICKDDKIIVSHSLLEIPGINKESLSFFLGQDINLFNQSNPFFTDICFRYESPNQKDVPIKERINLFYPGVKLCEEGCTDIGVNLTKMESICECLFSSIFNNDFMNNPFISNIQEFFFNSNLDVLKCITKVFERENLISSFGGFIVLGFFFMQIICLFCFISNGFINIKKFTFGLIVVYSKYLMQENKNVNNLFIGNKNQKKIKESKSLNVLNISTKKISKNKKNRSINVQNPPKLKKISKKSSCNALHSIHIDRLERNKGKKSSYINNSSTLLKYSPITSSIKTSKF